MAEKHTPGPLIVEYDKYAGYDCMSAGLVVREKGALRSLVVFGCADGDEWAKVNAHHLVACWNACEGINPEAVPMLRTLARETKEYLLAEDRYRRRIRFDYPKALTDAADLEKQRETLATQLRAAIAKAETQGETDA